MKIKLSKSQWDSIGKKGLSKKAGEDWMVNYDYTKQVAEELNRRGDEITSNDYEITLNHKIGDKVAKGLLIRVWEGSYEGNFILDVMNAENHEPLTYASGKDAFEAVDTMDNVLKNMIK